MDLKAFLKSKKFWWHCVCWTSVLLFLKFFGVAIITLLAGVIGYFPYQSYTNRYEAVELSPQTLPQYKEQALDFNHQYSNDELPFLASAVIDIENDGTEEIFLGGGKNQPDQIFKFKNNTFEKITLAGISEIKSEPSLGANVIDLDKNGFDDLLITRPSGIYWYQNISGQFKLQKLDIEMSDKTSPLSLTLTDLNQDGWVDVFVAGYLDKSEVTGLTIFNDPDYGGKSELFLNNGNNTFKNITDEASLRYTHNTFQGVFVDLDNDLDQDLVVAHDTGQVRTYQNNGDLSFTNTKNPTSDYFAYPMGIGVGDYNNDGLVDLAFSNVGNLGPMNFALRGDLEPDQVLNKKIIVFENQGDFKFLDTAETLKVADYEFSWGLIFADLNNDTKEDLIIAQNYVDLPQQKLFKYPGRILIQQDKNEFTTQEKTLKAINRDYGISPLTADFNNDGVLDLVYANLSGKSRVFLSQKPLNNFLKLKLPNTANSLGAKATLEAQNGKKLTQFFVTGEGMSSDSSHILHFGFDSNFQPQKLEVTWPNGKTKATENIVLNTQLELSNDE